MRWVDVIAVLKITLDGWMVNEMGGCNSCFKDYSGWMVSEMDGCNGCFKDYYGGWMKCQKNPVGPFVS